MKYTISLKSGTQIHGENTDGKNPTNVWREWLGSPHRNDTDTLDIGNNRETAILASEIAAIVATK